MDKYQKFQPISKFTVTEQTTGTPLMAFMRSLCSEENVTLIIQRQTSDHRGVSLGVSSLCWAGVCVAGDVSVELPWLCEGG